MPHARRVTRALALAAASSTIALSGCVIAPPTQTVPDASPAWSETPLASDGGAMTLDDAADLYLEYACARNEQVLAMDEAWGNGTIEGVVVAASTLAEELPDAVAAFESPPAGPWPDSLDDIAATLAESWDAEIPYFEELAQTTSMDEASAIVYPVDGETGAAVGAEFREIVGLDDDALTACGLA